MFNLMQKNDNIMNIVMLTMRELKNLLMTAGTITIFMINEEYTKGIQGIEDLASGTLFHSKLMLESGRLVETVSTASGETKTAMSSPEDIKYGYKDTQYIIQPIMTKEEEIQFVIQCESKISRSKKFMGFSAADE